MNPFIGTKILESTCAWCQKNTNRHTHRTTTVTFTAHAHRGLIKTLTFKWNYACYYTMNTSKFYLAKSLVLTYSAPFLPFPTRKKFPLNWITTNLTSKISTRKILCQPTTSGLKLKVKSLSTSLSSPKMKCHHRRPTSTPLPCSMVKSAPSPLRGR